MKFDFHTISSVAVLMQRILRVDCTCELILELYDCNISLWSWEMCVRDDTLLVGAICCFLVLSMMAILSLSDKLS